MLLDDFIHGYLHHRALADQWHDLSVRCEERGYLAHLAEAEGAAEFHMDMTRVCADHGKRLFGDDRFIDRLSELEDGQVPGQLDMREVK